MAAAKRPTKPRKSAGRAFAEAVLAGAASVVAPAAGAAIVTLAAPAKGTYRVRVRAGYGATPGVLNNMEIRRAAAALKTLFVPAVASTDRDTILDAVKLDGTQALSVNAIAAAGAGQIFVAEISATRVEDV